MAYLSPMVQNLALSMDKIIKKSKSLAEDKENEVTLQAIAQVSGTQGTPQALG